MYKFTITNKETNETVFMEMKDTSSLDISMELHSDERKEELITEPSKTKKMNYITWKEGGAKCTHPLVERVWQIGYDARKYEEDEPIFKTKTLMLMNSGERKEFIDEKDNFDTAEKYLQELNPNN